MVRDWELLGPQLTDQLALDADYQSTTRSQSLSEEPGTQADTVHQPNVLGSGDEQPHVDHSVVANSMRGPAD